jgi:hypothetical protein
VAEKVMSIMAKKSLYEDGTNVALGTKFYALNWRKVLPWYTPAEGKAPLDWKDRWARLRTRFEKAIDECCKLECVMIQRRIPASAPVYPDYPVILQGKQIFRKCNGLRIEPLNLLGTNADPLVGLFPFDNVRGEPMLDQQGRPVAFRLGLSHQFIVCSEIGFEFEAGQSFESSRLPIPRIIELACDGTNLLYQLPPEIAASLWRNIPEGFSRTENADDSLWFDALFQLSLNQPPGSPLFSKRYDWIENGSIQLDGEGLFPYEHDFSARYDSTEIVHKDKYPMAYYARLPDLARASVAAIDEILQRESVLASISNKRFRIGLSFPGEKRVFVEQIAGNLATKFGRTQILYDKFHEAEFARPELDIYLPNLYRTECDLIAVFLCADYANKKICRLEWRFIRQLITTTEANRIMLLSFDNIGAIHELGILEGDGYVSIAARPPREITELIQQRLDHFAKESVKSKNSEK